MHGVLATIGHNLPPGPIDFAKEAMADLSAFMASNPVIETPEQAKKAGLFVERMRKTLGDVEAERDNKVRPLNEQVAAINAEYKSVHNTDRKRPGLADKVLNELLDRINSYIGREEAKRIAAAEAKRREAEEAERLAREAEERERQAKDNASVGELDVDVGAAIKEADQKFSEFERASRAAALAERDVPVRISSSLGGRALSARNHETLILDDWFVALNVIGVTEKIKDAILSAARDYRRLKGKLPDGVSSTSERKI